MARMQERYFRVLILLICLGFSSIFLIRNVMESEKEKEEIVKIDTKQENIYHPTRSTNSTKIQKAVVTEQHLTLNEKNISQRMQERLAVLKAGCEKYDLPKGDFKKMGRFILVNDEYKIMYCKVPKVACTNWVKFLLMLQGHTKEELFRPNFDVHENLVYKLKPLRSYSTKDIEYRLKHYLKFMFVRDPWDRLVSVFVHKMENNSMNEHNFRGWPSAKKLREKYSLNNEHKTADFDGFLRFMLEEKGAMGFDPITYSMNIHWVQYYKMCYPCGINYDVIGKMETLKEDADYIISKANISIPFPGNFRAHEGKTSKKTEKYYSQISKNRINSILNLFEADIDLFGYRHNPFDDNNFN